MHLLVAGPDLGQSGVSYVEMLLLYELWAGERLVLEKAVARCRRPGRPKPVSAVPFGLGIDNWRSCRFIGAFIRSQYTLPGSIGRFMPCSVGANHCRLGHIGWERRGHWLTSRPGETALEIFLNGLLVFFLYPPRSAPALLAGALRAGGIPTWRLPADGQVARLVTDSEEVGVAQVEPRDVGVAWVCGSGGVGKRVRLNKNSGTPCYARFCGCSVSVTCAEETSHSGSCMK